ncbi:TPA: RNA-directed DNA polymerase [Candidatus Saccharibacteria bacterium]|nr:RNA-directed DNA polymerase [Candidatus Saccharibacteria bacterium]HIO87313.1 RNA-directed DNA polymerase [Candidatus Saccharibacteria bacterium]
MSNYSNKLRSILGNTKPKEARQFLLENGYFSQNGILPGIIKPEGLSTISLTTIDWLKKPKIPRTKAIKLLGQKPNKGMREYSLLHPYAYIRIVNELTHKDFWPELRSLLSSENKVSVFTVPIFGQTPPSEESAWHHFDTIEPDRWIITHPVQATCDIQNFYNSIYTHSIAWAVMGKETAKNNKSERIVGNRLDRLFQNANDGQTNGIPTGTYVSDIISELVLSDIDAQLSKYIEKKGIIALRYRDDYKFLCKSHSDARSVIDALAALLNDTYGFVLGQSKSAISTPNAVNGNEANMQIAGVVFNGVTEPKSKEINGKAFYENIVNIIDACTYATNKRYLDNAYREILEHFRKKELVVSQLSTWGEISINRIVTSIDTGRSYGTYGFALIDHILTVMVREDIDIKDILDRIVNHYKETKSTLFNLWLYMILLNNAKGYASAFLRSNKMAIFKMISNPSTPDARNFSARDPIPSIDIKELDKFSLINLKPFEDIEESKNESIIELLEDEDFGTLIRSHYDM